MSVPFLASIARLNFQRGSNALVAAGYSIEQKSYRAVPTSPEIGERHYVIVVIGNTRYETQWHERATHSTGFMANRGPNWDEATAARLTEIVVSAGTAPPEDSD